MEDYLQITPETFSARCCIRATAAIELAQADRSAWAFAIIDLHTALSSALVAALRGTDQIGAYTDKDMRLWWTWLNEGSRRNEPAPKQGRIAELPVLMKRAQSIEFEPRMLGKSLELTPQEQQDIQRLNRFRGDLAHVKPGHWSLEIAGLPRICGVAAKVLRHLFQLDSVTLHLKHGLAQEACAALELVLSIAARFPSEAPQ